MQSHIYNFCK